MEASTQVGWTCRNAHFTDRALAQDVCATCGAVRDPKELYQDSMADRGSADRLLLDPLGERESGERRFRTSSLSDKRGYVCFRCADMLASRSGDTVSQDAAISGKEQPGTAIEVFQLKQDLRFHIRTIHGGKAWRDRETRKMRRDAEK